MDGIGAVRGDLLLAGHEPSILMVAPRLPLNRSQPAPTGPTIDEASCQEVSISKGRLPSLCVCVDPDWI